MWRRLGTNLAIISCAATLSACASQPKPPTANGGIFRQHNEGYSLLYKLMKDESGVGDLFILKSASPQVKDLVKQIGKTCSAAKKQMDQFPKQDRRIEFDVPDLPYMEQRSRDLQRKADEKSLLTSGGKDFERYLIFTQAQAMDYATQLCKAIGEKETDPTRKTFLQNLQQQCEGYHDQLMKLLTVQT